MKHLPRKPIKWMGSSKKDLDGMLEDVKDFFGFAIDVAQTGAKHAEAKPSKDLAPQEFWRSWRVMKAGYTELFTR